MLTSWDFGMAGAGCYPFLYKHAHGPTILFEVSLTTVSHASPASVQWSRRRGSGISSTSRSPLRTPTRPLQSPLLGSPIIQLSAHWRVRANLWPKITRQHQAAFLMCTL